MDKNEKKGLKTLIWALAGTNTSAYIAGRAVDDFIPKEQFYPWLILLAVVVIICLIYYGVYRLLERIIERQPKVAPDAVISEIDSRYEQIRHSVENKQKADLSKDVKAWIKELEELNKSIANDVVGAFMLSEATKGPSLADVDIWTRLLQGIIQRMNLKVDGK